MSTLLKKKNIKKKKKNKDDAIGPQKHERIGNLNLYSEEIAKNIIEKIISFVISTEFIKKVESKQSKFCYNSIKITLDNITELMNINHEDDDFGLNNVIINSYIKYYNTDTNLKRYFAQKHDKTLESRNNNAKKNLIKKLKLTKKSKIYNKLKLKKIGARLNKSANNKKNKYLKSDKIYKYDITVEKKNFWGEIPMPGDGGIDRTTSKFNKYNQNAESRINIKIPKIIHKKELNKDMIFNKSKFTHKNFASRMAKNLSYFKDEKRVSLEDIINKKKKNNIILDMPSYPLKNIEVIKESDEIINIRKEILDSILEKENALKKEKEIQKKKEEQKKQPKKKGNYTYDSDGNLLLVKEIKQENLLKEFWPIMSKEKQIKQGKNIDDYKKEFTKLENAAKKNISYNMEDRPYNSYFIKSRLTQPFLFLNESTKNKKSSENKNKAKQIFDNFFKDKFNKYRIEPSGSNFQLINPSVGVKIKERSMEKSGGNDYYKEFHKYSIDEYNKTLHESIELNRYKNIDNQNIGFITTTSQFSNLKKINFNKLKNEEIPIKKNSNDINHKSLINDYNYNIIKIKNKYRNKNKNTNNKNIFAKTFTNGFSSDQNNKKVLKSISEIFSEKDNFIKLKKILFHDKEDNNKNKFNKLNPYKIKTINKDILFEYRNKSTKHINSVKKKFDEIDNLNKNIILGTAGYEKLFNKNFVLPKLSIKNNEINFNRTMLNFNHERNKKTMLEEFIQRKSNIPIIKLKGNKRANSTIG